EVLVAEHEVVVRQQREAAAVERDQAERLVLLRVAREPVRPVNHDPGVPERDRDGCLGAGVERPPLAGHAGQTLQVLGVPDLDVGAHAPPRHQLGGVTGRDPLAP
ncbi:MAG: hypothetical protein ACK56I_05380, partial [bacterium]